MKKCPFCTRIRPDAALVCLCGYNFDLDGTEITKGAELTTSYMPPDQGLRLRTEVDFMLEKVSIDKSAMEYGTNNCWSDVLIRDMSRSEAVEFILTGFNMENCEIRQKDSGTIEARHYYEDSKCWMPYAFVNRVGPFTYLGLHSNFDKSW